MTSSTRSVPVDDAWTPDSAAAPNTIHGAALSRVASFCQYARAHTPSDLIFHHPTAAGDPVQLFGVDLAVVVRMAAGWAELLPLVHDGLSEGTRAALDRIGTFGERYDAVRAGGVKLGPVVCSLDGTPLDFDDVTHVAYLLDFVDQVAKRNPITAVTPAISPFNDAMLDAFQVIYDEMPPDAGLDVYVKRAQQIWPEITSSTVTMTMAALATRSTSHFMRTRESVA